MISLGTVVRVTASKMLEYQRPYMCTKCKYTEIVEAVYDQKYIIIAPKKCPNPEKCSGTNLVSISDLDVENCKDYQEIKIQEQPSKLGVGTMPNSMWVTLEDDLVDACKPGDDVTICGTVKRRWGPLLPGKRIEVELVLKANHIQVNNGQSLPSLITPEIRDQFVNFWEKYKTCPLEGRDLILRSFCPKLYGMYLVKLAMAVVLAGGSKCTQGNEIGIQIRSEPHILLVGDPGTGKSQLLRYAAKIIPRSVLTTGVGTTSAGLTCAAIMEDGQWQLEGGALVLADGGICCIDEFNSMKSHDRTSIHEAMEQQTISVAKASMVCKLRTRCSILAATNPKGGYLDRSQPLSLNLTLPSPLLSRFDIVLMLKDKYDKDWDNLVADYILSGKGADAIKIDDSLWNLETLQKYFTIIRSLNPVLTPQANKILSSYYQVQRRAISRNKARTTVRLLDSLVRLSQAHARLMFHTEVQVMDALFAVILIENSMHGECAVLLLETIDVQAPFNDSPMENYKELLKAILNKLGLHDILKSEILDLNSDCQYNFNNSVLGIAENMEVNSKTNINFHFININSQKDEGTSSKHQFLHNITQKNDETFSIDSTNTSQTMSKSVDFSAVQDKSKEEIKDTDKENVQKNKIRKLSIPDCKQDEKISKGNTSNKTDTNTHILNTNKSHKEKKRRKSLKSPEHSKQIKVSKKKSNLNDFQMLNMIRSVNDEFDPNILDFMNVDDETVTEVEVNNESVVYSSNSRHANTEIEANEKSDLFNEAEINLKPENSRAILKSPNSEKSCTTKISQNTKLKQLREKFSFKPRNVPNINIPVVNKIEMPLKDETINNVIEKNAEISQSSQSFFTSKEDYENLNFDF
ncbi:hypothetical protein ILUMI_03319 [Ignelater luminosus]|uniref:DNA helicase n=1 Tax=Ignelater luminosus TaxID=2038154 RepID=A0A8K0DEV2_IGNLU|nr:hypothetical protein ILUMI_03319 [Ignelater luminosus]